MEELKRTKIVATIGPASQQPPVMEKLIKSGVNAFRLNFSHGDHQTHLKVIRNIQQLRRKLNVPVGILQDLTGPKIRLGKIAPEDYSVAVGDELILDAGFSEAATGNRIGINYPGFANDVFPGARLLLADGDLELEVERIENSAVHCRVIIGGRLSSAKGVNFPSGSFQVPAFTDKDKEDLRFGLQNGVDMVALSFVRSADDLRDARKIFEESGRTVPLFAKIEKHEAVENISEILEEGDGIMLARGDLGVEIEIEKIPMLQKSIISKANHLGKPVITATQMLRSMVESPRPTRAEVTDVANAILDGTDAVMLSEESAVGRYPVRAVEVMSRIACETEKAYPFFHKVKAEMASRELKFTESVAYSAAVLSRDIDARFIFPVTRSGYTAEIISKFRPHSLIIALTPERSTYYALSVVWGVIPVMYPLQKDMEALFRDVLSVVRERKLVKDGDAYVITSGFPLGKPGSINQVKAGRFKI